MMSRRTFDTKSSSPDVLRVTTSHFSGVVTIRCVSAISAFVSCMSPASTTREQSTQVLGREAGRRCPHRSAP